MTSYHRVVSTDDKDDEQSHGLVSHEDFRKRHTCTDVPCCLIFVVSLVAFGFLFFSAVREGDVRRLFHGIDSEGKICGVDSPVEDKNYLYWCSHANFAELSQGNFKLGQPVCVETCPTGSSADVSACFSTGGETNTEAYATTAFLERYCIPSESSLRGLAGHITSTYLDDLDTTFTEGLSSVPVGWPVILATFGVAVLLGYVHLSLLRCCAKLLLWLSILGTILVLGAGGFYLWANAGKLSNRIPDGVNLPEQATEHEGQVTRVVAILCWVLAGVAACVACCMHSSIDAASACIQVACSAIFDMPSLLLAPVLKAVAKVVAFMVLLYGFLNLYSMGEVVTSGLGDGVHRHFAHSNKQLLILFLYVLMAYWILCFMNALYQFMVAYAVAQYYYEPHDEDGDKMVEGCCVAWEGFHVGISFHSGSLAFGSFLMAFLHALQKACEYAEMKNKEGGDNKVVSCVLCVCGCCIGCLKEVVGFINKSAYIDIAINSSSFCTAARSALAMIVELAGAMAILNGATYVFAFFGSALITLISGAFAILACRVGPFADPTSKYHIDAPLPVALVSMCVAFLVSLAFMHVFDMASDTLLYCYGVDLHSGKGGHTAPHELRELVENHGHGGKKEDHHGDESD
mmetsp:Transcript_102922/g.266069  ORF Transcript_102922/g.266069 Transcript_102922/m.266069 type:complete len:630 (-) Transcript_102922:102-1991(-)